MIERVVVPADLWSALDAHLRAAGDLEDGAFILAREGHLDSTRRFVVHELLLPPEAAAWEARGNHRLRPSGRWLSAAIGAAIETESTLAFIHSHPDSAHPANLSPIDRATSIEWAGSIVPTLDHAFLSLVWAGGTIAGWAFDPAMPSTPQDIDIVEVVGAGRRRVVGATTGMTDKPDPMDDRQQRALGAAANLTVRGLAVAVVGAGGTGSPLIEQLARMGVASIIVVDSDVLDDPSNLRRVVGSRPADVAERTAKAIVARRHVESLNMGTHCRDVVADVRTPEGLAALIGADVVVTTTDTHSSRAFVNQAACQFGLPLIDVGVAVGTTKAGAISGMPADVRVVLPDSGCLICRGALDANRIRAENLPLDELQAELAEGYVQGVGQPVPSVAALNGFAASVAALVLLRLCTEAGVVETGAIVDGWELYVQLQPASIDPRCPCRSWRGQADRVMLPMVG